MNGSQQPNSSPASNNNHIAPINGSLLTPLQNGATMRRASSGHDNNPAIASLHQHRDASPTPSLNGVSSPFTPFSDNGVSQWSTAVGHATTGGKSGRVIEKLMTENDRLKRELNEHVTRAEELHRSMQTYKPKLEALQAENDNLSHARGVDSALISRRDRKIEELKADLHDERQRREAMEQRSRALEGERDEAVEEKTQEIQRLEESTRHATNHAHILETSHRQLAAEYRARFESARKDLAGLREEREEQRVKQARLDVVSDQMRQESERSRKLQAEFVARWEEYSETSHRQLKDMEDVTSAENERTRRLNADMEKVVGEMRWVMGVKKNMRIDSRMVEQGPQL